jgi:hypothetical protein
VEANKASRRSCCAVEPIAQPAPLHRVGARPGRQSVGVVVWSLGKHLRNSTTSAIWLSREAGFAGQKGNRRRFPGETDRAWSLGIDQFAIKAPKTIESGQRDCASTGQLAGTAEETGCGVVVDPPPGQHTIDGPIVCRYPAGMSMSGRWRWNASWWGWLVWFPIGAPY